MEEVDNIIIDSLRNLNCEFEESVESLKDFGPDDVVKAIVVCLEAITPGIKLPNKLGSTMTLKLKLASQLADLIKELGFRGDMGYQSILYCNEVEIRRVLMFLIERLPRDTSQKGANLNEIGGFVPKLVKDMEENVRIGLQKPWLPKNLVKNGARMCEERNKFIRQGYGSGDFALNGINLEVPETSNPINEAQTQYWAVHIPDVTKQCLPQQLIPSLLFQDIRFSTTHMSTLKPEELNKETQEKQAKEVEELLLQNPVQVDIKNLEYEIKKEDNEKEGVENKANPEDKMKELYAEIEAAKAKYLFLQKKFAKTEEKLTQLFTLKEKEDAILKDFLARVKVKSKTLSVMSKEENLQKLRALVENGNERMAQLTSQWNDVQSPLLEQYNSLKQSLSQQELKMQSEQKRIKEVIEKNAALTKELKFKENVEQQLIQECTKLPKSTNRSAYTRRILEIIGNIKKQNDEIQKVLKDTKEVQRDINNLNGQIDRSFTLSDELIFRDAKQDETARKAYKLLVALHSDCEDVIQTVTDMGTVERETRNLEEQIDAETSKGTRAKLERVEKDLLEIKKETATLLSTSST